jgi:hypothetical protein
MSHVLTERAVAESNDREPKARRAVAEFRRMLPMLNGYARALTGNRKVRVQISATSVSATDGTIIHMRPPLALGEFTPHDRRYCDKRDNRRVQICPACRKREDIIIKLYHEIAHIAFGSFIKPTEEHIKRILTDAASAGGSRVAADMRKRLATTPVVWTSYVEMAYAMNPWLKFLLNVLEDARIDSQMFAARPGTKVMYEAMLNEIRDEGIETTNPDTGEIEMRPWSEQPMNAQAIMCLYDVFADFVDMDYFHPDVRVVQEDERINYLVEVARQAEDASAIYEVSFPILERLRELGFCTLPDEEPEPEPEPQPELEPEGEEQKDEEGTADPDPDPDPSDDGEADPDNSNDGGVDSDDREDQGGEDDGGSSDEGGHDDQDSGDSDRDSGDADDSDGEAGSGGDPEDDTDGGASDEGEGGDVDDDLTSDATEDQNPDADPGAGSGGSPDERSGGASGGDQPSDGGTGGDPDTEGVDEGPGSGDGNEDPHPLGEEFDDQGDGDHSVSDGETGLPEDGSDIPDRSGDGPAVPPTPAPGSPEEVAVIIVRVGGHTGHEGDAEDISIGSLTGDEVPADIKAIKIIVMQGEFFEQPSRAINGVRVHKFGRPIFSNGGHNMSGGFGDEATDIASPESILGRALMRMRVAFTENQRRGFQRNLKSGRVAGRSLAKRAPFDDPRMFQKRQRITKRDYFVLIGLDISGSTASSSRYSGGRYHYLDAPVIEEIKKAAYAQAELCARLGVNFAVYAHTGGMESYDSEDYFDSDDSGMMVELYEIKAPQEPWSSSVKDRLRHLTSSMANLDGHTMEQYRRMLDQRSESDKIIMYYTDGSMPAENYHEELEVLQREIETCRKRGYTLMAVGVGNDDPLRYGLDMVRMDTEDDIIKVVEHLERRLAK